MTSEELDKAEELCLYVIQTLQNDFEKQIRPYLEKLQKIRDLRPRNYRLEASQYAQFLEINNES
jgi:hypothetical protein